MRIVWNNEEVDMVTKQKPMPFTKEEVEKIYNTNIIDFAVENGLILEKGDANTVHVKNSGGLYLFKHGRGFHWFTTGLLRIMPC